MLRSSAMGEFGLLEQDRYVLDATYQESGRIRIADRSNGERYQLKSAAAVGLDTLTSPEPQLFGTPDLILVIYSFDRKNNLSLFAAPAREVKVRSRRTFRLTEPAAAWGTWDIHEWMPDSVESFDQEEEEFDWSEYFKSGFDEITDADGS